MLVNIISQTHMLVRFAMDSNMLANILDFERLFEYFCSKFEQVQLQKQKEIFQIKIANSKGGSSTAKSQKFRWRAEDIERLIKLYEARPCLCDIAGPTYSKRDVREKALSEIKEELGIEISTIKSKSNSLRAQHGRELAKVKTKE